MNINSINDLFVEELKDLYSAEQQLSEALPQWVEAAHDANLKEALKEEQSDVRQQIKKLNEVFKAVGQQPQPAFCKGMKGLIDEAQQFLKHKAEPAVRDSDLIANIQRCKHYEIAVYGTLCAFGNYLDLDAAPEILHEILEQEKAEDQKFTDIAQKISGTPSGFSAMAGHGREGMEGMSGSREDIRGKSASTSKPGAEVDEDREGTLEMGAQEASTLEETGDAEEKADDVESRMESGDAEVEGVTRGAPELEEEYGNRVVGGRRGRGSQNRMAGGRQSTGGSSSPSQSPRRANAKSRSQSRGRSTRKR